MKYLIAFALFIGIHQIKAEEFLPDYIHPCTYTDTNFGKCVKEQIEESLPYFTKGIPELGVPATDPVALEDIIIDGNGLKLKFTKAQMIGLKDSKVTDLKVNFGEKEESFTLSVITDLSLIAEYNADGQILVLPIKGEGDAIIKCHGIEVTISSKFSHIKSKKGEHFKLSSPNYKYDIKSTTFDLKNLFNGNKQLADTTLQFVNENWKELMDDLAPPVIKQIVATIIKNINKFLHSVTIDRIIKEYKKSS